MNERAGRGALQRPSWACLSEGDPPSGVPSPWAAPSADWQQPPCLDLDLDGGLAEADGAAGGRLPSDKAIGDGDDVFNTPFSDEAADNSVQHGVFVVDMNSLCFALGADDINDVKVGDGDADRTIGDGDAALNTFFSDEAADNLVQQQHQQQHPDAAVRGEKATKAGRRLRQRNRRGEGLLAASVAIACSEAPERDVLLSLARHMVRSGGLAMLRCYLEKQEDAAFAATMQHIGLAPRGSKAQQVRHCVDALVTLLRRPAAQVA